MKYKAISYSWFKSTTAMDVDLFHPKRFYYIDFDEITDPDSFIYETLIMMRRGISHA